MEYLNLAQHFTNDWNYGNAIHTGYLALGLVELRCGNVEKAKEHLLAAGNTPGSIHLESYGPEMGLARELLERGEKDVVIQYLDLVANFWAKDDMPEFHHQALERKALLEQWKAEIREGQIPDHELWN